MLISTYLKIPLADRLERLEAGNSSSPQFSGILMDNFHKTPVFPILEKTGLFGMRRMMGWLMDCPTFKAYYGLFEKPNEDITLGDLATIIASLNQYGNTYFDKEIVADMVKRLVCVYFSCFDSVDFDRQQSQEQSFFIQPHIQAIYDFLLVPFGDYFDRITQCSPLKYTKRILDCTAQKHFTRRLSLYQIYRELRSDAGIAAETWFWSLTNDPSKEKKSYIVEKQNEEIVKGWQSFIDLLIIPIAMIQEKERTENEKEEIRDEKGELKDDELEYDNEEFDFEEDML